MARRPGWSTEYLNDGGPLIALPRECLAAWMGGDGEPTSPDEEFGPDYARACAADHPAALLAVGTGHGLVIGAQEHIYPAQWVNLPERRGVGLVGWMYSAFDARTEVVRRLLRDGPEWTRLRPRMDLKRGELLLIHAADPGADLDEVETFGEQQAVILDAIPFRLAPGSYSIEVQEIDGGLVPGTFGCVLCRWLPADH